MTDQAITTYPHPEAGWPFQNPDLPPKLQIGFVVGNCGHRVSGTEFRAGLQDCERCPKGGPAAAVAAEGK